MWDALRSPALRGTHWRVAPMQWCVDADGQRITSAFTSQGWVSVCVAVALVAPNDSCQRDRKPNGRYVHCRATPGHHDIYKLRLDPYAPNRSPFRRHFRRKLLNRNSGLFLIYPNVYRPMRLPSLLTQSLRTRCRQVYSFFLPLPTVSSLHCRPPGWSAL